jgi:uncharacterized membrane protein YhaH (DUF805 family)
VLLTVVAFAAFLVIWPQYRNEDQTQALLGILPFFLLPLKFSFLSRRLHDAGCSAWLASPVWLLLLLHVFSIYWIRYIPTPWYIWPWNPSGIFGLTKSEAVGLCLCGTILATDAALWFARGAIGKNAYGQSPIGQHHPAEVF